MNEITQDMGVKQAAIAARRHKSGKAASFCMSFGMLPFERTGKKTLNVKKGAYQVRTHLPGLSLRTGAHTPTRIVIANQCAHTYQDCHCEPVRTLAWQSVLPAEKPGNLVVLRANP